MFCIFGAHIDLHIDVLIIYINFPLSANTHIAYYEESYDAFLDIAHLSPFSAGFFHTLEALPSEASAFLETTSLGGS